MWTKCAAAVQRQLQTRRRGRPRNSGAAARICWPSCRKSRSARRSSRWRPTSFCAIAATRANDFLARACRDASIASSPTILPNSLRVDELVYAAAKLVPGLTPTRQAGRGRKRAVAKRERRRRNRPGHFPRASAGRARRRHASLRRHAAAEAGIDGAHAREFIKNGVIDFGPARLERQGKAAVVTIHNPRFLNAEDDDTLDATETAVDIAIFDPQSEICVLRGGAGRSSEIPGPQGVLQRHQSDASLSRQDSVSLVHAPRHGAGEQDAARPRHGRRQPRRSLWRHAREAVDRRRRHVRHRRRLPVSAGDGLRGGRLGRLYDAAGAQGGHHSGRRQFAAAALCRRRASRGRRS